MCARDFPPFFPSVLVIKNTKFVCHSPFTVRTHTHTHIHEYISTISDFDYLAHAQILFPTQLLFHLPLPRRITLLSIRLANGDELNRLSMNFLSYSSCERRTSARTQMKIEKVFRTNTGKIEVCLTLFSRYNSLARSLFRSLLPFLTRFALAFGENIFHFISFRFEGFGVAKLPLSIA